MARHGDWRNLGQAGAVWSYSRGAFPPSEDSAVEVNGVGDIRGVATAVGTLIDLWTAFL